MNTLFISGAGFNIFIQGGAIKYINHDFNIYAGTSSGSFISCAMVLGWNIDDLYEWSIRNQPTFKSCLSESVWRLATKGYLISESGKQEFIRMLIQDSPVYKKYFDGQDPTQLTFRQVTDVTQKYFLCNSVAIDGGTELFSPWTSPNISIHWAVGASMSLLGLFGPARLNDKLYIDGGFNEDYLPTVFKPGSKSYYKTTYPNVDIPISLDRSWGILYNIPPPKLGIRTWSVFSLIKFVPTIIDYVFSSDINREPLGFFEDRTWVVTNESYLTFPSKTEIESMYKLGYQQAYSQGRRGLGLIESDYDRLDDHFVSNVSNVSTPEVQTVSNVDEIEDNLEIGDLPELEMSHIDTIPVNSSDQ